ncbi:MAG TPA: glycosyltransferase family 39 protein [Anaerolineales bacterium]|nr:glycosyltransferase family 39 protein [Anaerolineales bacterium]
MSKLRSALPYLFIFLLAALVLDLGNPLFDKPARDGGFFLYAGSQIISGKIPYVDFWDSKGPAIFYINALGLFLGQGSRWGVWGVEFVFVFTWLSILYKTILKQWQHGAAVFGITLAALGLRIVLGYGNYTEEYALLFNALAVYLFFVVDENKGWKYFGIGLLFGISFSFRANNIGGLFAVLIAIALAGFVGNLAKTPNPNHRDTESRRFNGFFLGVSVTQWFKSLFIRLLFVLAGFAAPLLLWVLFFQIHGAAWEMIFASIIFNFSYASAKSREWLDIFGGFGRYGMLWVGWVAAFGYVVNGYHVLRKALHRNPLTLVDWFLFTWFPFEILLSNLSGRNFSHYYISWALAVAVYGAALFTSGTGFSLPKSLTALTTGVRTSFLYDGMVLFFIVGLLLFSTPSIKRYGETVSRSFSGQSLEYSDPLVDAIRANTQQDDLVLTWYPETTLNFMAGRASPVKYVYYPLFLEGTLPPGAETSYIEGLTSRRPEMIVDCSRAVDAIPSLDPATREDQFSKPGVKKKMYFQPGMEEIFNFVAENYHVDTSVDGCLLFRLNLE